MKKTNTKKLKNQIGEIERHLKFIKKILEEMGSDDQLDYENMPGVEGTFDGSDMVTENGEKYKVPENYAAKSLLLYGTRLKMIDLDGRSYFKNISKVKGKEVEGILSKKEGKWYILADSGSYKISEAAAAFQGAFQNAEATALIPEDNLHAPFAALKKVIKPVSEKPANTPDPKQEKPQQKSNTSDKPKKREKSKRPQPKPAKEPMSDAQPSTETEEVNSISLGTDDLR